MAIGLPALREKLWDGHKSQMADYLGIAQNTLSDFERGKRPFPKKHWPKIEELITGVFRYSPEVPEIIEESTMENRDAFMGQVLDIIEES